MKRGEMERRGRGHGSVYPANIRQFELVGVGGMQQDLFDQRFRDLTRLL